MNRSFFRWALLSVLLVSFSATSFAGVFISVRIGPPPLPVYAQPICPGPGYMWTPGYWAWSDYDGYYWVPGTWVLAPVGMYWTPGWWGWGGGVYIWHAGYWGPHVGYYGGIVYGYGYTGVGFHGGEWRGRDFYYNRSVTNVSVTNVTNVYNRTVIVNNTNVRNVSYNGGNGGVQARPTPQEERFNHERHIDALPVQQQHEHGAMQNRQNFAAENHGRPAIAATARPADFSNRSVVAARAAGGEYHPPAMSPREARVVSNNMGNRGNDANRGNSFNRGNDMNRGNNMNRGNENRRNDGFRPFTPPSRNGGANSNAMPRNENSSFDRNAHGSSMGNGSRYNDRPARDPYRPPNNGHRADQPRPSAQSREMRPSPPPREMRSNPPQREMRSSPPPREMRSTPAPRYQGPPPKEDRHR